MSKREEIQRLIGILQEYTLSELRELRRQLTKKPRRIEIPKVKLRKFIKQNR